MSLGSAFRCAAGIFCSEGIGNLFQAGFWRRLVRNPACVLHNSTSSDFMGVTVRDYHTSQSMASRYLWVWISATLLVGLNLTLAVWPALADQGSIDEIQQAIQVKGLGWKTKDYGRTFAAGDYSRDVVSSAQQTASLRPLADLPAALEWRNKDGNWVSPVKDQGDCGSCWAFSAVGATEAHYAIAHNSPGSFLDLSEQILVSCSGNYGCDGGDNGLTAQYMQTTGAASESCYPYIEANGDCDDACSDWQAAAVRIVGYMPVARDVAAIKQALQNGPVVLSLDLYGDFYSYAGGVYEYALGDYEGGHSVLAVGYVDTPGQYGGGYFIVKNSWGARWGENGYFRIGYSQVDSNVVFGRAAHLYSMTTTFGDEYEPDNDSTQANAIISGEQQTHSIMPAGDEDWVQFTLTNAATITLTTSGPNDADTYLYLYDASLEQIEADDDDGDGFYSLITATLDSGVYYVRVTEYNSDDVIATYYLDLVASSVLTCSDPYEPNDAAVQAIGAVAGEQYVACIGADWDEDWYQINVPVCQRFQVMLYGNGERWQANVSLLAADGVTLLDRSDVVTPLYPAMLDLPVVEAGAYYLIVRGDYPGVGYKLSASLDQLTLFEDNFEPSTGPYDADLAWDISNPQQNAQISRTEAGQLRIYIPTGDDECEPTSAPRYMQTTCESDFCAETAVTLNGAPGRWAQYAGLLLWQDVNNYVNLTKKNDGTIVFTMAKNGEGHWGPGIVYHGDVANLRIRRAGTTITLYAEVEGEWQALQTWEFISGPIQVGLTSINCIGDAAAEALFDYFRVCKPLPADGNRIAVPLLLKS